MFSRPMCPRTKSPMFPPLDNASIIRCVARTTQPLNETSQPWTTSRNLSWQLSPPLPPGGCIVRGRIVQRTPRTPHPSKASSKWCLVQVMPRPSDASSKWCLVQGTHHPRLLNGDTQVRAFSLGFGSNPTFLDHRGLPPSTCHIKIS